MQPVALSHQADHLLLLLHLLGHEPQCRDLRTSRQAYLVQEFSLLVEHTQHAHVVQLAQLEQADVVQAVVVADGGGAQPACELVEDRVVAAEVLVDHHPDDPVFAQLAHQPI